MSWSLHSIRNRLSLLTPVDARFHGWYICRLSYEHIILSMVYACYIQEKSDCKLVRWNYTKIIFILAYSIQTSAYLCKMGHIIIYIYACPSTGNQIVYSWFYIVSVDSHNTRHSANLVFECRWNWERGTDIRMPQMSESGRCRPRDLMLASSSNSDVAAWLVYLWREVLWCAPLKLIITQGYAKL